MGNLHSEGTEIQLPETQETHEFACVYEFKDDDDKDDYFQLQPSEAQKLHRDTLPRQPWLVEGGKRWKSRTVYLSQMSESRLVGFRSEGKALDEFKQILNVTIKDDICGLHNVSKSDRFPGHLWLSLQYSNEIVLFDTKTKTQKFLKCPNKATLVREENGKRLYRNDCTIGGPHCVRENNGVLWVALKGALACNPNGGDESTLRACCSTKIAKERMVMNKVLLPGGCFGIWACELNDIDAKWTAEENTWLPTNETVYECKESPAMMDFDKNGNCWASQDLSDSICFIRNGASQQVRLPQLNENVQLHCSGPSVVADPNGNIWCTQLRQDGCLVRISPKLGSSEFAIELLKLPANNWGRRLWQTRTINIAFHREDYTSILHRKDLYSNAHTNPSTLMFVLSSSLLDKSALDGFYAFVMDSECSRPRMGVFVELPRQGVEAHRIFFSGGQVMVSSFSPLNPDGEGERQTIPGIVYQEWIAFRHLYAVVEIEQRTSNNLRRFEFIDHGYDPVGPGNSAVADFPPQRYDPEQFDHRKRP